MDTRDKNVPEGRDIGRTMDNHDIYVPEGRNNLICDFYFDLWKYISSLWDDGLLVFDRSTDIKSLRDNRLSLITFVTDAEGITYL